MVERKTIFNYKTIKGPLHKIPAIIKLILLLPLSILCLYLPSMWILTEIILITITAFFFGITINDQLTDLKPAVFYIMILYLFSVISNTVDYIAFLSLRSSLDTPYSFSPAVLPLSIFIPGTDYIRLSLRLIIIIQISALVFRTTSLLEIRYALRLDLITLFIGFIPEIFKTWSCINTAWKARSGRSGINKIKTLLFILITISFEKAAVKSKALEARRN